MKAPPFHYGWVIVFAGTVVVFLSHGLGRMAYSVILPPMRTGLGLSHAEAGLIGTANFLGYLCFTVFSGILVLKIGARKTIFSSLLVMGAGLCLTGLSTSFLSAAIFRFITGLANGGAYIPAMTLPALWFGRRRRGLASGVLTIGTSMGLLFNGMLLPAFMARFGANGWRHAWFLIGALVLVLSFPCFLLLIDRPPAPHLVQCGEKNKEDGPSGSLSGVLMGRGVWQLGVIYLFYGLSYIIYLTFYTSFLLEECNLSFLLAGKIFGVIGALSVGSGVLWGWLSDLLGRARGFAFAHLVLACSYLLPVLFRDIHGYYASSILFGLTMSSVPAIMAAASSDTASEKLAAFTLGVATVFFGVGQSVGPGLAGYLRDVTGSFHMAFILCFIFSLSGAVLSISMRW